MNKTLMLPLAAMFAASLAAAQQPALHPNQPMVKPVVSPEVQPDRSITFRISAPTAQDVKLRFDGKDLPMAKGENGVWQATVGPVAPEVYDFAFDFGGARVNNGYVEVPGNPTPNVVTQDVPHGTVTLMRYVSKVQNRPRNLRVYLPPQYYTEPARKFPVLYLYNGGDETEWTASGRANNILDNAIAANKAVPMVVVMPNNRINDGAGRDAVFPPAIVNMGVIERELPTDIFPLIEKHFRVHTGKQHRAIAGLSFGGGTAFGVGMRNLDKFSYIGEFGTGLFGGADTPPPGHTNYAAFDPEKVAPGMIRNLKNPATKPKLFYMSVGESDPRAPHQKKAYEDFRKEGVDVSFTTYPGGHEFKAFRQALADFVTRIFQ